MGNRQRFAFGVVVTGICLVLMGCGGSSGVTQDEHDALQAELEAKEQALMEEQAARQQAEADKLAAEAARQQAEAEELAAETARQQAEADELAAETARQQAETARQQAEEAKQKAQQAEVNARAGTFIEELIGGNVDVRGASVTWQRGDSLKVDPGGNFARGSGAPGISGFNSHPFTRRTGTTSETAYLYTNIQSPGTRAFWKVYGLTESLATENLPLAKPNTAPTINYDGNTETATGATVTGTFNGATGTFTCTGASCVDAGSLSTVDTTNPDADTVAKVRADDTVPAIETENGVRTFANVTGSWEFKPSSVSSGVTIPQDDAFLYFGIWASEPDIASGSHNFQVVHGGGGVAVDGTTGGISTVLTALANYDTITGRATFGGGAIGKYVTRNQVGENARIGTFTAQADFTANFDNDTLEGRITNFREGGQELAGWDVFLGATATTPASVSGGTVTAPAVATARIGRVVATGTWAATLYGSANPGGSELQTADAEKYPLARYPAADLAGVAGHFSAADATDAANANAAIAGAFAATPSN